ncbi:MAG: hypothetical protein H6975_05265 [Gammaproteobacteria bacterium]|nr:hypothetical protein [Gammaproteobacteria bacterium]
MEDSSFWLIGFSALVAIVLLAVLAGRRRMSARPLPDQPPMMDAAAAAPKTFPTIDAAIAVAIAAAVNATTPGARVTRIEKEF